MFEHALIILNARKLNLKQKEKVWKSSRVFKAARARCDRVRVRVFR